MERKEALGYIGRKDGTEWIVIYEDHYHFSGARDMDFDDIWNEKGERLLKNNPGPCNDRCSWRKGENQ